jgi:hypothetical protein
VHAHPTVRDDDVSVDLEPYRVLLSDGTKESIALDPEVALKAVRDPGAMARLANVFIEVRDNLAGGTATGSNPRVLADVSVGLGLGKLSKMVLGAQLESGDVFPKGTGAARLSEMFRSGTWEVRLTALSSLVPKDVLRRELFLFGMDGLPALSGIMKNGLRSGEAVVFGMKDGKGTITAGQVTEPIPDATDKARAFLEFCFLGAILEHQAEVAVAR